MIPLIDTHAHLSDPDFAADLPEVMARARDAGINRIITIGTDLESSLQAVELAGRYPEIRAVVGWHPGHAAEAPDDFRNALRAVASRPGVSAIGECGLDFHRLPSRMGTGSAEDDAQLQERQAALFVQQLEVAAELGLNVVIHTRDSFPETLARFEPYAGRVRAVFHCFVGTPAEMQRVMTLGSLVSFTGILTFKNGGTVRETLKATPAGRFMLETDCPYLAPMPYRGRRCEPAYVREIATTAAEVTGRTVEEIAAGTGATAREFFRGLE